MSIAGARAAASLRNGAKSRGPKTPDGKTQSARNALSHGLRAQRFVVGGNEKAAAFAALERALADELVPDGALPGPQVDTFTACEKPIDPKPIPGEMVPGRRQAEPGRRQAGRRPPRGTRGGRIVMRSGCR